MRAPDSVAAIASPWRSSARMLRLSAPGLEHDRRADAARTPRPGARHDGPEAVLLEDPIDVEPGRTRVLAAGRLLAHEAARGQRGRARCPSPVAALASTIGASASGPPASASRTSSSASSRISASTRSHLLRTTRPRSMPSSGQMARCSRVWGITPSSAATTSITRSRPAGARHHRAHEALVARHVDDGEPRRRSRGRGPRSRARS